MTENDCRGVYRGVGFICWERRCAEPDDAHRLTCQKCRATMGPDEYRSLIGRFAMNGLRIGRAKRAALERLRAKVDRGELCSEQFTEDQVLREMRAC